MSEKKKNKKGIDGGMLVIFVLLCIILFYSLSGKLYNATRKATDESTESTLVEETTTESEPEEAETTTDTINVQSEEPEQTEEVEEEEPVATVDSEDGEDPDEDYVYEEPIMPDGLYLYFVDSDYVTVGITTTGTDENGLRTGKATFYSYSKGQSVETHEASFIEDSEDSNTFTCSDDKYILKALDYGALRVQRASKDDTETGFENTYIFIYGFDGYSETVVRSDNSGL
jgi:hypothetical protein